MSIVERMNGTQALRVLALLISAGMVKVKQIQKVVAQDIKERQREINAWTTAVTDGATVAETASAAVSIVEGGTGDGSVVRVTGRRAGNVRARGRGRGSVADGPKSRPGRKPKAVKIKAAKAQSQGSPRSLTAEQAASRKIQGQYLGAIRHVPKSKRAPFKSIAQNVSRENAIRAIKRWMKDGTMPGAAAAAATAVAKAKANVKPKAKAKAKPAPATVKAAVTPKKLKMRMKNQSLLGSIARKKAATAKVAKADAIAGADGVSDDIHDPELDQEQQYLTEY